ncbi:hypothetical protein JXB28_06400 [Candidatus Woesearchaeota archaeon]|nr:hypothetical protein [Candidatus Woesearchaeota archaeon]
MRVCNGVTKGELVEAVEVSRLEPVVIEVEENDKVSSYLILFEMICKMDITQREIIANGEIQQTIFETKRREMEE